MIVKLNGMANAELHVHEGAYSALYIDGERRRVLTPFEEEFVRSCLAVNGEYTERCFSVAAFMYGILSDIPAERVQDGDATAAAMNAFLALSKNPIAQANQPGSTNTRTLTDDSAAPTGGEKTGSEAAIAPVASGPDGPSGAKQSDGHTGRKLADLGGGTTVDALTGPRSSMEDALLEDCDRLRQKIWKMGEALKAADSFITNGVELGYIRMPDKDCPDSAHAVPGLIREALSYVPPEVAPRVERCSVPNRITWVIEKGNPAQYFMGFDYGAGKWTLDFREALQAADRGTMQRLWDCDPPIFTVFNDTCRIADHVLCGDSPPEEGRS